MLNSNQNGFQNSPLFIKWLKDVCLTNINLIIYGPVGNGKTSLLADFKKLRKNRGDG